MTPKQLREVAEMIEKGCADLERRYPGSRPSWVSAELALDYAQANRLRERADLAEAETKGNDDE